MTPQEFLQNPEAQDAVFDHRFGSYVQKYGPEGAARAWFAGEGGMKNPNARDVLGTSVEDYGRKFTQNMGGRSIQWDAPQAGAQKLSTVQQRQRDIAEMKANNGVWPDDMMAQETSRLAPSEVVRAGSAVVCWLKRRQFASNKRLKVAIGAFKALTNRERTGNLVTAQFSAEERTGLARPTTTPVHTCACYTTLASSSLAVADACKRRCDPTESQPMIPRTRGEIQAQRELYK